MPEHSRSFEIFLRQIRPILARHHGEAAAAEIEAATRAEYPRVRPLVPDIGGRRNVFQPVMTVNGWVVALHRAMAAQGLSARQTIQICHEAMDAWLRRMPRWLLRGIGALALSAPARAYFERQARRSQAREHPEDFVWKVERGADGEFSFVFDECAVNKWYDALGERELKPYCNFADVTYSRLMGMGVNASETIGQGCAQCALRFQHGRETPVPSNLAGVVATEAPGA